MRRVLAAPTAAGGGNGGRGDPRAFKPEKNCVRDRPVAFATVLTPPRPRVRASTAAHRRNMASSSVPPEPDTCPRSSLHHSYPKSEGATQSVQVIFAGILSRVPWIVIASAS